MRRARGWFRVAALVAAACALSGCLTQYCYLGSVDEPAAEDREVRR